MRSPAEIVTAVVFCSLPGALMAAPPDHAGTDRIRAGPVYAAPADFPNVQILVEVPVPATTGTLAPDAFRVRADGGAFYPATRVQTMAASGYSMAVAVVLDASGSMQGAPLNAIRKGLSRFAGDAGQRNRTAILTVADDVRWEVNWDSPPDKIPAIIRELSSRGRLTRLWDGLFEAVDRLPETPEARRVIVISDGHDEGSSHTLEDAIGRAQKRGVAVDAIGVTQSDPKYLAFMRQLAAQTSGQFRAARTESELARLVGAGIERLRSLPVVAFRLNDLPADGKSHTFEVFWRHDGAESSSKYSATVPEATNAAPALSRLWPGLAAASALLIVAGILIGLVRRRRAGRLDSVPPPASAPQPVEIRLETSAQASPARPVPAQPVPITAPVAFVRSLPREYVPPAPSGPGAAPTRFKTQVYVTFPAPLPERPAAWLYGEEGSVSGQWYPVDTSAFWIGADENNHLRIQGDPTISGNHACIVFETDALGVYDYGSTNGTLVNGESVGDVRRLLQPGDRIRVGRSVFAVQAQFPGEQGNGVRE